MNFMYDSDLLDSVRFLLIDIYSFKLIELIVTTLFSHLLYQIEINYNCDEFYTVSV